MANEIKLKKWNGSTWVQQYPEVRHTDIVTSGTPSSSTFLRGDGQWASVEDSGNQFVNITGDTMTGVLTLTNNLNITNEKPILMSGDYYVNKKFDMLENASPQYILLCASGQNNEVMGTLHINRSSSNYQAATLEVVVSARSNEAVQGAALRTLQVLQSGERYEIVTATYSGTQYIAIKYSGHVYPETVARFTGRMKSTGSAALLTTVGSSDVSSVSAFDGTTYSSLDVDTMHFRGNVGIGTDSPGATLDVNGALFLKGRVFGDSDGTNTYLKSGTSGKIYFETNGGTRGGIDASGNFGIGTISPAQKLEVDGNINANELHLNDTNTILKEASSGNSVRIQTDSGYGDVGSKNTGWFHFDTDRPAFYMNKKLAVNGDIYLYGQTTTKLESSTGHIFELGNRVATQSYVGTQISNLVDSAPGALDTLNELAAALGDDASFSTTITNALAGKLSLTGGTMTGGLVAGGGISGLTISNGISGSNYNITGVNELQFNDPGEGIRFMSGSSGTMDLKIIDDSNDNILEYSGSNAKFRVAGSLDIKSSNPLLTLNDTSTNANAYIDYQAGTSLKVHAGGDALTFVAGNAERARIASNGNVGIGTTSPSALLEVHGDLSGKNANGARTEFYRLGGVYFTWDGDTYGTQINHSLRSVYGDNSWGDHITLNSYGHIRMNIDSNNNGSNRFEVGSHTTGTSNTHFSILDTGNVGIGTISPSYGLDVYADNGTIRAYGTTAKLWAEASDSGQASLELKNTEGHFRFITDNGGYSIYDQIDAAERFAIDTNGNSTIRGNLTVISAYPRIFLTDTDSNSDYSIINGDGTFSIYDDTNGVMRMQINSSGDTTFGSGAVVATDYMYAHANLLTKGNLYLNYDNNPAGADAYVYFGDDASDTAHWMRFDNSAQQFGFSNRVVGTAGRLGAIESNGSDVDKVNFQLSGTTLTITTS